MIQVQIVVAGGLGDLALSMFPELHGQRRQTSWFTVPDQATAAAVLARLTTAGIEVVGVAEQPCPSARTTQTG